LSAWALLKAITAASDRFNARHKFPCQIGKLSSTEESSTGIGRSLEPGRPINKISDLTGHTGSCSLFTTSLKETIKDDLNSKLAMKN
jgi:hypothetical protein